MKMLIKNGRVIDPANGLDDLMDILVENGKIVAVKPQGNFDGEGETEKIETVINASGMWVVAGLIDMHVHLRDPGQTHKETIKTGTQAAAAGGFTTVCCMPNTSPTIDSVDVVEYITAKAAAESLVRVLPVGSITKGLAGEKLSAIEEMKSAGICAISDDGKAVENAALYAEAMAIAKVLDLTVLAHCEDAKLTGKGQINAGESAKRLNLVGIPSESEEIIIARDITLARMTGARLHICHVSTARGVELIRAARKAGQPVTAEVTPHHFTLTDEDITTLDANFKMSPPLRSSEDRAAIQTALKDGTIDAIATDHAPHHIDEKINTTFESAANGIIGLETAVPLAITELVETRLLTPSELIAKFTSNPAKILRVSMGSLSVGEAADITIINPTESYTIDKNTFQSLSKNTPFHGRKVTGRVNFTIVAGKIVYSH
ncbi:MAG: dihydroorotase [Defluviitaleaceae bacterium]|nr:dihydroorotase [Defluviitaleaceae bacterium]